MSERTSANGRAAVWVDLGRQGGAPCIFGTRLPTHTVAGLAWEGGLASVLRFYPHITEGQALGACWYEVEHGRRRKWRSQFPDWPTTWDEAQWRTR